jgi:hypothetical protein
MATHLESSPAHEHSTREIDRLLKVFSELDDACIQDEQAPPSGENSGKRGKRPQARLSEPVLHPTDYCGLLDGARQIRAFARRVNSAPV